MIEEFVVCAILASIYGIMKFEDYRQPSPEIDQAYIEWAQQKKKTFMNLPSWRIVANDQNVSQKVRNEVLAEIIKNGTCKDMKHLEAVAKAAQLDEPVTLTSDKKIEQVKKWVFFTDEKVVVTPKTPLERAHHEKNEAAAAILKKLAEQQRQQKQQSQQTK